MYRVVTFFCLAFLTACSVESIPEEVKSQAAKSDAVLLCELDATGPSVRFKYKQNLKTNGLNIRFTAGQFLPFSDGPVEQGISYGDEAILFLSPGYGSSRLSAHFRLYLYEGKTTHGDTREDLIRIIQEAEKK